jgi:hypothetical protein
MSSRGQHSAKKVVARPIVRSPSPSLSLPHPLYYSLFPFSFSLSFLRIFSEPHLSLSPKRNVVSDGVSLQANLFLPEISSSDNPL